eukprot:7905763-Pyramimonas_sp.AAC.1
MERITENQQVNSEHQKATLIVSGSPKRKPKRLQCHCCVTVRIQNKQWENGCLSPFVHLQTFFLVCVDVYM